MEDSSIVEDPSLMEYSMETRKCRGNRVEHWACRHLETAEISLGPSAAGTVGMVAMEVTKMPLTMGAVGTVLTVNGSSVPAWINPYSAYGAGDVGKVLRVSAASTVSASPYTMPATAGTANQSLVSNGTNLVLSNPLMPPTFLRPFAANEWGRFSSALSISQNAMTATANENWAVTDSVGTPDIFAMRWKVKGYVGSVNVTPYLRLVNFQTDTGAFVDILLNSPEAVTSGTFTGTSLKRWGAGGTATGSDSFSNPASTLNQATTVYTTTTGAVFTGDDTITVVFTAPSGSGTTNMTFYGIALNYA